MTNTTRRVGLRRLTDSTGGTLAGVDLRGGGPASDSDPRAAFVEGFGEPPLVVEDQPQVVEGRRQGGRQRQRPPRRRLSRPQVAGAPPRLGELGVDGSVLWGGRRRTLEQAAGRPPVAAAVRDRGQQLQRAGVLRPAAEHLLEQPFGLRQAAGSQVVTSGREWVVHGGRRAAIIAPRAARPRPAGGAPDGGVVAQSIDSVVMLSVQSTGKPQVELEHLLQP